MSLLEFVRYTYVLEIIIIIIIIIRQHCLLSHIRQKTNLKLEDVSIFTTTAATRSPEQAGGTSTAKTSSDSVSSETGCVSHRVSRNPVTLVRSRITCQMIQYQSNYTTCKLRYFGHIIHNKIAFQPKADHLRMRVLGYVW